MLTITFSNSAGPMNTETAKTKEEALDKALDMLRSAGELLPGDKIEVSGEED